jgi:hypothetical protein
MVRNHFLPSKEQSSRLEPHFSTDKRSNSISVCLRRRNTLWYVSL